MKVILDPMAIERIATNRLDQDSEPQPDVVLFIDPACGGQSRISDDD
jgi:hypothetical protein